MEYQPQGCTNQQLWCFGFQCIYDSYRKKLLNEDSRRRPECQMNSAVLYSHFGSVGWTIRAFISAFPSSSLSYVRNLSFNLARQSNRSLDFEDNPEVFNVFALHDRPTHQFFSSDVFIFDSRSSQVLGVILGIQYQRVFKLAMANLLARLTPGAERTHHTAVAPTKTNEERIKFVPSQANPSKTT
jgi:hypothetical protein